jgi:hypothetical protein
MNFSVADITVNPVLLEVYAANDLKRFVEFGKFSRSIYVLESNWALEQLAAEYQVKLSDQKLTPIDRERLEREFESKHASISKSGYAVQFLINDETRSIPRSLIHKALNDVLAAWARRAAIEKKALDVQVAVLSPSILDEADVKGRDYLIPLLLLRRRVDDVLTNISAIAEIPGAELVRTSNHKSSLREIRLRLDTINRYRLEPLISTARAAGQTGSVAVAIEVLNGQLAYDERLLAAARMRQEAIRNALLIYDSQASSARRTERSPASEMAPATGRPSGNETVMPQLSESFLDRIIEMTNSNADRVYRQRLNDEIKSAALAMVPLEETVEYDKDLITKFKSSPAHPDPAAAANLDRDFQATREETRSLIEEINEIYHLASRQLNPATELFRITGPTIFRVDRAISAARIAVFGGITVLIAIPLVFAGVVIHNRIREERAAEKHMRAPKAVES